MIKDSDPKYRRVSLDDPDCSTWEWCLVTETAGPDIEDHRPRQLPEEAAVTLEGEPVTPPVDANLRILTTPCAPEKKRPRTLDDMRKLSEEIKRNRQRK